MRSVFRACWMCYSSTELNRRMSDPHGRWVPMGHCRPANSNENGREWVTTPPMYAIAWQRRERSAIKMKPCTGMKNLVGKIPW